jgi:hypothetical protein
MTLGVAARLLGHSALRSRSAEYARRDDAGLSAELHSYLGEVVVAGSCTLQRLRLPVKWKDLCSQTAPLFLVVILLLRSGWRLIRERIHTAV